MAPLNPEKLAKKDAYLAKLRNLVAKTEKFLIIEADFVGSKQMQQVRIALRGKAVIVMGKNTMIRTALRQHEEASGNDMSALINVMRGNLGFVFVQGNMDEVQEIVTGNKVPAAAKAGVIAPVDVSIPGGPTSLDPSQTNFFQALNIATKIVKGQIEISSEVRIVTAGTKVQASQQALLQKLNIRPFEYGLVLRYIYDNGNVFGAEVLKITDEVLMEKFMSGVRNVAAFSRSVGVPTEASLPHAVMAAFKNCAALCSDIDYSFPEIAQIKEFLADPSKFATASGPSTTTTAAPVAAAAVEEEEEEEEDMGFDLFD